MKTFITLFGMMLAFSTPNLRADITTEPVKVPIKINKVYIPRGFDSNDVAQFAIEGDLPNSCYRVGAYAFEVDKLKKQILVTQTAYVRLGFCLQMIIPYSQMVNVGMLPEATYSIVDTSSKVNLGSITITKASNPGPDDYLYAPITDAYVAIGTNPKKHSLVLTGTFPDHCTELAEVRVNEYPDTIVVQPIARRTEVSVECPPDKVRFSRTVELSDKLQGVYLLHVRSLNGSAVNRMIDFP